MTASDLFIECWRSGITLNADGADLVIKPASKLSGELKARLIDHKQELLRFLAPHGWLRTPHGPAKFVMSLEGGRCGVVLKSQPDRVTWLQKKDITLNCVESCECQQVGCPTEVGGSAVIESVKE